MLLYPCIRYQVQFMSLVRLDHLSRPVDDVHVSSCREAKATGAKDFGRVIRAWWQCQRAPQQGNLTELSIEN